MNQFDVMRQNGVNYLTGGSGYAPTNPRISFVFADLDKQAGAYWRSLFNSSGLIWDDYPDNDNHGQTAACFKQISIMCMAYAQYGSRYFRDEKLRDDIIKALDWMNDNRYSVRLAQSGSGDWWFKEISCGLALGYILLFMGEYLTPRQIQKWVETIDAYNPNGYDFTEPWGATTAVNRLDKCVIYLTLAICAKDEQMLKYAMDGMVGEFQFAKGMYTGTVKNGIYDPMTLHDGFYEDGSYLQHVGVAHTCGYGTAFVETLPFLLNVLSGTKWLLDLDIDIICEWVRNSYIPVIFRGGAMDFVKDREIARQHLQSHMMGHRIASAICGLAAVLPNPDYFKAVVKGWIQGDSFCDFFSYTHEENQRLFVGATIRMNQLVEDASIEPIYDFTMGRMFAVAARAVQFRPRENGKPAYAFNVGMNSIRNKYYEAVRDEGCKHWYINEGMTCYYSGDDLAHYDAGYWATVDLYRLPGTTVDTKKRADNEANNLYSTADWAGGVQLLDKYAAAGYQLSAYGVSLRAKKSWFMLDGKIVCLGTDIHSTDGRTIETIVESRKYKKFCEVSQGKGWLHYAAASQGGFYFPQNPELNILQEKRTGDWSALGGSSSGVEENNFFTCWIDHGKNPQGAQYEYIFLPGATATETQQYAACPDITILENSVRAQAVKDAKAGITGVNFWADEIHTVGGVTCDKQASFMMLEGQGAATIAVSDPTWKNGGDITIEISKPFGGVVSKDDNITVVQTAPTLIFKVRTSGAESMGKTYTLELQA